MSKTPTPSTIFGSSGTFPESGKDAPSPPRNRSTTASALASWSIAGAEGDGDAEGAWLIDGSAEDAADADADGAADPPGEADGAGPLVLPGGYVHVALLTATGAHAATPAATSPPPADAQESPPTQRFDRQGRPVTIDRWTLGVRGRCDGIHAGYVRSRSKPFEGPPACRGGPIGPAARVLHHTSVAGDQPATKTATRHATSMTRPSMSHGWKKEEKPDR